MIAEKAILADRKNPLPVHQKGNTLRSLEKLDRSLEVLEEPKGMCPSEKAARVCLDGRDLQIAERAFPGDASFWPCSGFETIGN